MNNADMPAAPCQWVHPERGTTKREIGLTKREYFSAIAMQGILSHPKWPENGARSVALDAVRAADALLSELENKK